MARPTEMAAPIVRTLLLQHGIAVAGQTATGKAPVGAAVLWQHRSAPLWTIIQRMALVSDNHIAEQLLRAVGANASGFGSLENGILAEKAFLSSLHVDVRSLHIADGSGISDANRITAQALAAALRSMVSSGNAAAMAGLLPRVGLDGTVRWRPVAPDVAGSIVGKDGYIEGASGLAGYVKTRTHGVVIYAFLVDDWPTSLDAIWADEDRLLAQIARM
jgi:D-alanyl-D-alanine carboxypeptidase/D-alanyl-D-alanine-endopeptidase (penicillin-binding protein 4)